MEHARRLDTADRYLNTRCVRYAFRADECTTGDETIALFLREGDTPQQSLFEMQVMWYELASGASWFRQKQWGRALKKLTAIDKVSGKLAGICAEDVWIEAHDSCGAGMIALPHMSDV